MKAIDRILERISEDIGFWTAGTPCAVVSREEFEEALAEARAQALREAADEMEAEYEERTAKSGAYGQMKIRAALLMGAGMVRNRADRMSTEETTEED